MQYRLNGHGIARQLWADEKARQAAYLDDARRQVEARRAARHEQAETEREHRKEQRILRNVIADVLRVAKDDDFIVKATTRAGGENNAIAKAVIDLARPHLVGLCGSAYQKWRA